MAKTPRLELKAYEAPEAKALRAVRATKHSWIVKASRKSIDSEAAAIAAFMGFVCGFPMLTFGAAADAASLVVPGIIAMSPIPVSLAVLLIALPSKRRESRAVEAVNEAAAKDVDREIQSWLQDNYGFKGRDYDIEDVLTGASSIPIDLYTSDEDVKITVEAKLNRLEDGSYDLRKTGVKDATESIYFTPINANSLTAARTLPELTAERS